MTAVRISAFFAVTCLFYAGSWGQEETRLECGDKSVQDVVDSALQTHNKNLVEGNQLALYQVLKAMKAQNESGEFLSVSFTGRETNCPVGGDKVWTQCDYLRDPSKALRTCSAKALLKETNEILSVHCSVEQPIVPDRRPPCLGCPVNINVESEEIKESLGYSVSKANTVYNHTHFFILSTVRSATRQVIAGFRYRLQIEMQKSNCSKAEHKELNEQCHLDMNDVLFIHCNSTVDIAPWRHEVPETYVVCAPPRTNFERRRPPGWSPLRNIHNFMEVTPKPKKDESSEESKEGKTAKTTPAKDQDQPPPDPQLEPRVETTSPSPAACPGKPWKEFKPARTPPPPPSNRSEQALSDVDLLG